MEFYIGSDGVGDVELSQGCCYNRLNMYEYVFLLAGKEDVTWN